MRERILSAGIILLIAILLFLAAGAFPQEQDRHLAVFKTPFFLAVVAAGAVLMLAACLLKRPLARQIPIILCHTGLAAVIAGAFAGWLLGEQIRGVRLPVAMGHAIGRLHDSRGQQIDLGFTIAIKSFSVSYYEPVYSLFKPNSSDAARPEDFQHVMDIDLRKRAGELETPAGLIQLSDLRRGGEWTEAHVFTNGWVLRKQPEVPSRFEAVVEAVQGDETKSHLLVVNDPLQCSGWRVLLVSYGKKPVPYVELSFQRNPGRAAIIGGIWCVIAGTALSCWRMPGGSRRGTDHES